MVTLFILFIGSKTFAATQSVTDKNLHTAGSAAITLATYTMMRLNKYNKYESIMAAGALTLFIGVLKEVSDPNPDMEDIRADTLGAGAAMFTIAIVHW